MSISRRETSPSIGRIPDGIGHPDQHEREGTPDEERNPLSARRPQRPGHTPGYYVLVVSSGIDRAIPPGDTVACPLQLTETDIAGSEDGDEWT